MVGYKREISKHNQLFHVLIFVSWVWREIDIKERYLLILFASNKSQTTFFLCMFFNEHSFEKNSSNRVLWLKNKSRSQVPFDFFLLHLS